MNPEFSLIDEHYKKHFGQLSKRYARSTGSDAAGEDIVHDAYEKAMRYYGSYDGSKEFERWFSLILRNSYRDYMRHERGQPTEPLDEFVLEGIECDGLVRRIWKEVEDIIEEVNPNHREILHLHYIKDYPITDISYITEHSLSNCTQVVSRFRKKIKELYKIK